MRVLLRGEELSKTFYTRGNRVQALDRLSFSVNEGESLGIVGESGSGKSTLARVTALLERADHGAVFLEEEEITRLRDKRRAYRKMQLIFQNAAASFDPQKTLKSSIAEVLRNYDMEDTPEDLLALTGLPASCGTRYPHQLSGGECRRAALARALAVSPKLLVCDEITAGLDVSVQAQILRLLSELKERQKLSYLLVSHDLAVVRLLCEKIAVLYGGRMVEYGSAADILHAPVHPYTQALVGAAFTDDVPLPCGDEVPRAGCSFVPRCAEACPRCRLEPPELRLVGPDHYAACFCKS